MSKTLKNYALYAEILSALAVIASLMFVASEVRLNTRSIQVSAYQDLIEQIGVLNTVILDNPEIAQLESKIAKGGSPENDLEKMQYLAMTRLTIRHADMAFYQYENGLIDEVRLKNMSGPLISALVQSVFVREVWKQTFRDFLPPDFSEYIERIFEVATGETIDARDT